MLSPHGKILDRCSRGRPVFQGCASRPTGVDGLHEHSLLWYMHDGSSPGVYLRGLLAEPEMVSMYGPYLREDRPKRKESLSGESWRRAGKVLYGVPGVISG